MGSWCGRCKKVVPVVTRVIPAKDNPAIEEVVIERCVDCGGRLKVQRRPKGSKPWG